MKDRNKASDTHTPKQSIIKKMMEDKAMIRKHLASGGKLSDLREKGINFVQPI